VRMCVCVSPCVQVCAQSGVAVCVYVYLCVRVRMCTHTFQHFDDCGKECVYGLVCLARDLRTAGVAACMHAFLHGCIT